MRVLVNDVRLFFDVEGAGLVPDGPIMRKRPTLLLLHGGPGFDHSTFKPAYSSLAECAQVIYLDHRGNGWSDAGSRGRHGRSRNGATTCTRSARCLELSVRLSWEPRSVARSPWPMRRAIQPTLPSSFSSVLK